MTRSPSEDRRTEGLDGPSYPLNIVCPVPGCTQSNRLERHHLWRRSDVIGDKWWVRTKDGKIHGNVVKLCGFHHLEVTQNTAHIAYADGTFWWKDILAEPLLLTWQPPEEDVYEALRSRVTPSERKDDPDLALVEKLGAAHVLQPGHDPDICPTCLRKLPKPKDKDPEAPKVRKTWSVAVPLDHWEDGADMIDTLLEEAHRELNRNGLPFGEGKKVKYYLLTTALGLFVTHAQSIMSDE